MIKEGYTRVTEVVKWANNHRFANIDPNMLRRKGDIGTNVHEAIDGYDEGIPPCFTGEAAEREKAYFASYKIWNDAAKPKIVCKGTRYYCDELKLTGAVDMIILNEEGREVLIDFKTSASPDLIGWPIQGILYYYLSGKRVSNLRFIMLNDKEKKPKIFDFEPTEELLQIALECISQYRYWHQ